MWAKDDELKTDADTGPEIKAGAGAGGLATPLKPPATEGRDWAAASVKELQVEVKRRGLSAAGCFKRSEIEALFKRTSPSHSAKEATAFFRCLEAWCGLTGSEDWGGGNEGGSAAAEGRPAPARGGSRPPAVVLWGGYHAGALPG